MRSSFQRTSLSRKSLLPASLALALLVALSAVVAPLDARAQSAAESTLLEQFEEKTTTFTLDNGLTFVVIERHDAPVISFHTYADVGAADEPIGQSGLAHLFEHLAFKGTTSIGTKDIESEMASIAREEEIFEQIERERARRPRADTARIARLEARLDSVEEQSKEYLSDGGYDQILERNGVSGLNAYTGADQTGYVYSLPSNKLELFFALESDRFLNPVFREFYTERDVVMEERRQRTESSPIGRLLEEFTTTAFKAHPYGIPTIGHMSDLERLSREDARAFFDKYYGPSNLTIGIAGDVDPARAKQLAEKYFSRLEGGEEPIGVSTEEPEQISERRVIIREQSQPTVIMGWHRPSMFSDEAAVYDVLQDILTQGRTSRLYKTLVEEEKALRVQAFPSYPGSKYPTLFGIIGVPNREVGPEQLEEDIYTVLEDIKENGVSTEEVERAKTRARAQLVNSLDSNDGLAQSFSRMEELTGSWREVFQNLDAIQRVTAADVQRVAQETFQRSNRTVAMIKTSGDEDDEASEATASAE